MTTTHPEHVRIAAAREADKARARKVRHLENQLARLQDRHEAGSLCVVCDNPRVGSLRACAHPHEGWYLSRTQTPVLLGYRDSRAVMRAFPCLGLVDIPAVDWYRQEIRNVENGA